MCDLRVASQSAIFGVFCRRCGVPLIDGGTARLLRLIGLSRELDLILTDRPVDAAGGARVGGRRQEAQPVAVASALQAASIAAPLARPSRRIRRRRESRNVLSKFATDSCASPASRPSTTSVARPRIFEVTGAQMTE
jgi:enoyl-CoA hydratase